MPRKASHPWYFGDIFAQPSAASARAKSQRPSSNPAARESAPEGAEAHEADPAETEGGGLRRVYSVTEVTAPIFDLSALRKNSSMGGRECPWVGRHAPRRNRRGFRGPRRFPQWPGTAKCGRNSPQVF